MGSNYLKGSPVVATKEYGRNIKRGSNCEMRGIAPFKHYVSL